MRLCTQHFLVLHLMQHHSEQHLCSHHPAHLQLNKIQYSGRHWPCNPALNSEERNQLYILPMLLPDAYRVEDQYINQQSTQTPQIEWHQHTGHFTLIVG